MISTQWSPFRELDRMREAVDWLFEHPASAHYESQGQKSSRAFPVRVAETDDGIMINALLPGFRSEDIEMRADQGRVTIHAHRQEVTAEDQAKSVYNELWEGDLYRVLNLPQNLDFDHAEASLDAGVMTVRVPKSEAAKPKRIEVRQPAGSLN